MYCRDKDTGSSRSGSTHWHEPSQGCRGSTLQPARLQCWDASGQAAQAGTQPHPSADRLLKIFLSTAHLPEAQDSALLTTRQEAATPIRKPAQASSRASSIKRADSRSKKTYDPAAGGTETIVTEERQNEIPEQYVPDK